MPVRVDDPVSGAIIFVPTPEESQAKHLAELYEEKLGILDSKIAELDSIIQKAKGTE